MLDVQNINFSKIIKRLELIKSLISLEEEDYKNYSKEFEINRNEKVAEEYIDKIIF